MPMVIPIQACYFNHCFSLFYLTGKPFPNIPNTFEATFDWNMAEVNTTYLIREVFSEELNLGIMVIENLIGPAIQSKLYTYAQTGEFIYVPCK